MAGVLLRLFYLVWFVVALGLSLAAFADLLFGGAPFNERLNNLAPRIVIALVWPLAAMTPRGRYLLWARWQYDRK